MFKSLFRGAPRQLSLVVFKRPVRPHFADQILDLLHPGTASKEEYSRFPDRSMAHRLTVRPVWIYPLPRPFPHSEPVRRSWAVPMKVAVTDYTFDSLDTENAVLAPLGHTVVGRRCKTPEELAELVADADAVLTQFAPVNAAVIAAMSRAKIIVRYGIGVDNVDLEAAKVRGIPVCNIPDYCIDEVADHTLALILVLTRQIVPTCNHLRPANGRCRSRCTPCTLSRH